MMSSYLKQFQMDNLMTSFVSEILENLIRRLMKVFYLLKVNNRNTRTRCQIHSKLTIKTPERCQWRRSGVFIVNFKHISHLVLLFLVYSLIDVDTQKRGNHLPLVLVKLPTAPKPCFHPLKPV